MRSAGLLSLVCGTSLGSAASHGGCEDNVADGRVCVAGKEAPETSEFNYVKLAAPSTHERLNLTNVEPPSGKGP